jgi:integrase
VSVRKRTWTGPNGEEKSAWIVDYPDAGGKRRQKTFARKKDADNFSASSRIEIRDGVHVPDSETVTVKEAAALWLASCDAAGLERATVDSYRGHVRLHILPFMATVKLNKAHVPEVRAFQDRLRQEGRSAAMVKRVTVSLGGMFADAQERGLVNRNPVRELSKRRGAARANVDKRQRARLRYGVDIPTMEEVSAILGAAEGRFRPFLVTAIFTGMRASELRGLKWADVDFSKAALHVRQRADKYHEIGMPKSDAGQRTIPLTPLAVMALKEWKLACPKGPLDLVFPNGKGNVEFHQNIVKRGLWPALVAAGVIDANKKPKYTGLHALRHWFASWCINTKADGGLELSPKAVQTRMGHSSIQVTYDTYGHLFPAADESQALALAEARLLAISAT